MVNIIQFFKSTRLRKCVDQTIAPPRNAYIDSSVFSQERAPHTRLADNDLHLAHGFYQVYLKYLESPAQLNASGVMERWGDYAIFPAEASLHSRVSTKMRLSNSRL